MVTDILIAMLTMVGATVAVHLGLFESIAVVVSKVAKCNQCATFWLTFLVLVSCNAPLIIVPLLSIIASYLSNWFMLLLIHINNQYDKLWEKLSKSKHQ